MTSSAPANPSVAPQRPPWRAGLMFWVANLGAALLSLLFFVRRLPTPDWGYAAAEWLTSYAGGFVRRGLFGSFIAGLPQPQLQWVLIGVTALFLVVLLLMVWFVWVAGRRLTTSWVLLLWLAPGGVLLANAQLLWQHFPPAVALFTYRKEYVGLAILLAVSGTVAANPGLLGQRRPALGLGVGLLLAIGVLGHESAIIPAVAGAGVLLLLAAPDAAPAARRWTAAIAAVGPPALISLVTVMQGPAPPGTAAAIIDQLDPTTQQWFGGADRMLQGSPFSWLESGAGDGIGYTMDVVVRSGAWPGWIFATILALCFAGVVSLVVDPRPATVRARLLALGAITLATAPLFILGADTGRWVSMIGLYGAIVLIALSATTPASEQPAAIPRPRTPLIICTGIVILLVVLAGLPETGDARGLLLGRWQ